MRGVIGSEGGDKRDLIKAVEKQFVETTEMLEFGTG